MPSTPISAALKRLIDIGGSFTGLVVFSPLFLICAILVKRDSAGPIFYRQIRVGRGGHHFHALKFRTMRVANDDDGITSNDKKATRVTKSGAFLRKYRIDELPQLWNVLVGDMSLVGPRPQIPKYIAIYPDIYAEILTVRPGITGLASIKFHEKEERMLEEAGDQAEDAYIHKILPLKFHYNLFYVRNRSLCFDLAIIWWTAIGILGKK